MKLIIRNNKVIATASDEYNGADTAVDAPENFDISRMAEYEIIDSAVVLTKDTIWTSIKAIRDYRTQTAGYQVAGNWYHSDTFSRTQQLGLVLLGASIPSGLQWKTMAGTFVTMTQTLAGQIFAAAAASDQALFAYAEQLRAEVDASEIPQEIDINAGWPAGFGE